ncbi:MAG: NAD(P)-dependent oxidoreductase, partial [Bacteroidota bacterium]
GHITPTDPFNVITVLADKHHYLLRQYLHPSLRLETYDPVEGWSREQILRADAVLVRTTNPLNAKTLPADSRVRFAGTASAGRDHLDEPFLQDRGIHIADAKGSNADSVAEYVAVAVLSSCEHLDIRPESLTAGIIGAGFTGSATASLLERIGITCRQHDPPREEREKESVESAGQRQKRFHSATIDEVLSCDILTHHVPLERSGDHATWHWLDKDRIRAASSRMVINASRGGVVDEAALRSAYDGGHLDLYICDVWENEPFFSDATASQAFLATPHIAGYSVEAKRKATEMICEQLHRFLGLPDPDRPEPTPIRAPVPEDELSLLKVLRHLHPAFSYDASLRKLVGCADMEKGPAFLRLRQETPLRNEFPGIRLPAAVTGRFPVLEKLGFSNEAEA